MAVPKRMNFRESSKWGWGVIFNPKNYNADFGSLYRALNRDFRGEMRYNENEGEGGVSKAV